MLASIPSLSTRLVMFDTAVVDMTDRLDDPVKNLLGLRFGGGTNIDFEGGSREGVVRQVTALLEDGVTFITLLALNDQGAPRYHAGLAQELADLGAAAFACTPEQFPELMGRALNRS